MRGDSVTLSEWESFESWRRQLERRLNELGSQVRGNQSFQADRISDVVEQIAELRRELAAIRGRQEKIADWLKANCVKCRKGESCENQS